MFYVAIVTKLFDLVALYSGLQSSMRNILVTNF